MIKVIYPQLFAGDPEWQARAERVAEKTYELSHYLVDVLKCEGVESGFSGRVTYHVNCHLARLLNKGECVPQLLSKTRSVEFCPMEHADECCGFGGLFALKYADISAGIGEVKLANAELANAEVLTSTDMGCLMHLKGLLRKRGKSMRVAHFAQILAEETPETVSTESLTKSG